MSDRLTGSPLAQIQRLSVNVKAVAPDEFRADCQCLTGCVAYGRTKAEAKRSMGQAVLDYLAGRDVFLLMDPVNIMDFHEV